MSEKKKLPFTKPGRVSFPSVYEKSDLSGVYELSLIWPEGTDLSDLEKAVEEAARARWEDQGKNRPSNFRGPLRDCEEKSDKAGYENGGTFARFWRKTTPQVVDKDATTHLDEESGEFYAGCWARVSYTVFAYSKNGNNGVAFGLQNIQKIRDDEGFAGLRTDAEDDFGSVTDDDFADALS